MVSPGGRAWGLCAAGFPDGCATPVSVAGFFDPFPVPATSIRACGSPAPGSPTPFTTGIRLFPPVLKRPGCNDVPGETEQAEMVR